MVCHDISVSPEIGLPGLAVAISEDHRVWNYILSPCFSTWQNIHLRRIFFFFLIFEGKEIIGNGREKVMHHFIYSPLHPHFETGKVLKQALLLHFSAKYVS